jgi:hypothetical protein
MTSQPLQVRHVGDQVLAQRALGGIPRMVIRPLLPLAQTPSPALNSVDLPVFTPHQGGNPSRSTLNEASRNAV